MFKEINSKIEWENFLQTCSNKSFLNSWNWGEFQLAQGNKIFRLGLVDNSRLQAVALAIKIKARRGTYLLIQHGPSIAAEYIGQRSAILKLFLQELSEIGKKENACFIRMNPLWSRNGENSEIFKKMGLRLSPMHANAYDATWKLDIDLTEDELMKGMRKTTRYLIRQAQKNPDISIVKSNNLKDLSVYQELNRNVAQRQKFVPFSEKYIKDEFEVFSKDGQALWLFGKYQNEIAAGALVIFWQQTAYYHQAASISKYAKLSIPYLLQWEAIKEAKNRGCNLYDFWGYIDPKANPKHPWAGPTLFKMGYGGQPQEYVRTQDYVLSPMYWPIYLLEKLRKLKRGL